jgi:hypothetical protein
LKDFNKRLLDEKAFLEEYDSISLFEEWNIGFTSEMLKYYESIDPLSWD